MEWSRECYWYSAWSNGTGVGEKLHLRYPRGKNRITVLFFASFSGKSSTKRDFPFRPRPDSGSCSVRVMSSARRGASIVQCECPPSLRDAFLLLLSLLFHTKLTAFRHSWPTPPPPPPSQFANLRLRSTLYYMGWDRMARDASFPIAAQKYIRLPPPGHPPPCCCGRWKQRYRHNTRLSRRSFHVISDPYTTT